MIGTPNRLAARIALPHHLTCGSASGGPQMLAASVLNAPALGQLRRDGPLAPRWRRPVDRRRSLQLSALDS